MSGKERRKSPTADSKRPEEKSKLATVISLVLAVSFLTVLFFPAAGAAHQDYIGTLEKSDYNIYDKMTDTLDRLDNYRDDPAVLNSSREVLHGIPLETEDFESYSNVTVMSRNRLEGPDYHDMANLFDRITEGSPIYNESNILDFLIDWSGLLPRPNVLNYWIYVNYSGHEKWVKATMRSRLMLHEEDGQIKIIKDPWQEIDIDDDPSTGDVDGDDIRVRLTPDISPLDTLSLSYLIELIAQGGNLSLDFTGGFALEIEKLGGDPMDSPLEVGILKSISYEGRNNLISLAFTFPAVPSVFTGSLQAGRIRLANILSSALESLINGGIAELGNVSVLTGISGPYTLSYMQVDMADSLHIDLGLAKLIQENGSAMEFVVNELINIEINRSPDEVSIPRSGQLLLNNEGEGLVAPIDEVRWTAGYGMTGEERYFNLRARYLERTDTLLTYAKAYVVNVPPYVNITMDYTKVQFGKNVTVLDFLASDSVESLDYYEYEMPVVGEGTSDQYYKCSHVAATDVPPRLHIEVTSDVNRNITLPGPDTGTTSVIGRILDSTLVKLMARFKRLGMNIRYLPENMMTIPGNKGWLSVRTYNRTIGAVEFIRTSGTYLTSLVNGSFIASMNLSAYHDDVQKDLAREGKIPDLALSGRLYGLKDVDLNFRDHSHLDLNTIPGPPLYVELQNANASAMTYIEALPEHIIIDAYPDRVEVNTDGYIPSAVVFSRVGDTGLALSAEGITKGFHIEKSSTTTWIESYGHIERVDVFITQNRNTFLRCSDTAINSFVLNIEPDSACAHVRINGLLSLKYRPGKDGVFEVHTTKSLSLFTYMHNSRSPAMVESRLYMTPLPNNISIKLPGLADTSEITLPNMANLTGVSDLPNLVLSFGEMGTGMINLLSNTTQILANSIGTMGSDMNLSYDLGGTESMELIMEVKRNWTHITEEPPWVHGVSINKISTANESQDPEWAKIYLSGLPNHGLITSKIDNERIAWNISFKNYNPRFSNLIIRTSGLRGRTITTYINGIQPNSDLDVRIDMKTYLGEDVGEMAGNMEITTSNGLGEVYTRIVRTEPIHSIREVFIPKVPKHLKAVFNMTNRVHVDYEADSYVEYMYVKISKYIDDNWHPIIAVIHDLPRFFTVDLVPTTVFDFDGPLPLQGLPSIDLSASDPSMDMHVIMDGRAAGQKGKMELYLRNAPTMLHSELKGEKYTITSSGRLGMLSIEILSLPMAEQYTVEYLRITAIDVNRLVLGMRMVFGVYPLITVSDSMFSRLYLDMKLKATIGDTVVNLNTAIMSIHARGMVPTTASLERNKILMDRSVREETVYLIPMPVLSLFNTLI